MAPFDFGQEGCERRMDWAWSVGSLRKRFGSSFRGLRLHSSATGNKNKMLVRKSQEIPWWSVGPGHVLGPGLIPGQGTEIMKAMQQGKKKVKWSECALCSTPSAGIWLLICIVLKGEPLKHGFCSTITQVVSPNIPSLWWISLHSLSLPNCRF